MANDRRLRGIAGCAALMVTAYVGLLVASHPAAAAAQLRLDYPWANHLVEGGLLVTFVSLLVLLGRLLTYMARASRRWTSREGPERATRATVMVEFVLVLPVLLTLMAMVIQIALLANASLVVRYAAFAAARSAIVRLEYWFTVREGPPTYAQSIGDEPEKVDLAAQLILAGISPRAADPSGDPAAETIREIHQTQDGPWGSRHFAERMTYAVAATTVTAVPSPQPLVPEFPDDLVPPWVRQISERLGIPLDDSGIGESGREVTQVLNAVLDEIPQEFRYLVALPQVEVTIDYGFLLTMPGIWGFLPGVEDAPAGVAGKAFTLTQTVRLQSIGARQSSPLAILPLSGNSPLP